MHNLQTSSRFGFLTCLFNANTRELIKVGAVPVPISLLIAGDWVENCKSAPQSSAPLWEKGEKRGEGDGWGK